MMIPEPHGSMVNNLVARGVASFDSELERAILAATWAPLSDLDRAASGRVLTETRRWCDGFPSEFMDERRAAGQRFLAQGATGALLQNVQAGWTSQRLDSLEPRDFDLVERIVRERQPDGLARLLSSGNAYSLNLVTEGGSLDWSALLAAVAANGIVAALSACELGVNDCSATSPQFKQWCLQFGGCHTSSVGELVRYVLARDGLDPQWLDREAERVVRAIREGNLEALGIRRKPSPR